MTNEAISAVQTITTAAMSPEQGSQVSGNIDPANFSSLFSDFFDAGAFPGLSAGGSGSSQALANGANGIFKSTCGSSGIECKFGSDEQCVTARTSGADGTSQPFTVSFRARINDAPKDADTGNAHLAATNTNSYGLNSGPDYGVQIKFKIETDHQKVTFRLRNVAEGVDNEVTVWDSRAAQDVNLIFDGFDFWSDYHVYAISLEVPTSTTTKVTMFVDGQLVTSLTEDFSSDNVDHVYCGGSNGGAMLGDNMDGWLIDSLSVQQGRG